MSIKDGRLPSGFELLPERSGEIGGFQLLINSEVNIATYRKESR
tara:strand:- start:227 stop:358 length:132 start_codon:yes stop_codon:yes gene_type:complete